MSQPFLFRGVSTKFHLENKGLLKPKLQTPFTYEFHWDEPGFTLDSGVTWDSTPTNAVIRHQYNQEGFPTSGISFTPHIRRAAIYALGKDNAASGYIFKIDRHLLKQHKISEFVVANFCTPSIPEDDEVILVMHNSLPLPSSVIFEIIPVSFLTSLPE